MHIYNIKLKYTLHLPLMLILVILLILSSGFVVADNMTVSTIDVGQGDSIFIQFPNSSNMLVDAGDSAHGKTVVSYLNSLKISKIDILVATHPHADHIGGMSDVLGAFKVGKVWDSGYNHGSQMQRQFLQIIKNKNIRYGTPKAGFTEQIGTVRVDVLAPVRSLNGTESDANNNSIILRISYGKVSFLLMGDAETEERATVGHWSGSTVLKVAHHGSRNSTDAGFLKAVAPKIAIISVAAQNSYGHPHQQTMRALKNAKVKVYATATSGTIIISSDGKTLNVKVHGASAAVVPRAIEGGRYIGNVRSHVFHRPTYPSLPAEKNRIYLSSCKDAIAKGFRPCGRCQP